MSIPQEVVERVRSLDLPACIGVSGFGGSGKSVFANELGAIVDASVVSVDSFQRNGVFDGEYSCWEIMDFARLEKEVIVPFSHGEPMIRYGHYDVSSESIIEMREFKHTGRLIVEGVGLFRPELQTCFNLMIWIDCPIDTAISRGKKRDRDEYKNPHDEQWDGIWRKNDEQYFAAYHPKEVADVVVQNC